jgi:hypothetical protein
MLYTRLLVPVICLALSAGVVAGEWPQWAGPVEYTVALDSSTGKTIWEFENRAPTVGPPVDQ